MQRAILILACIAILIHECYSIIPYINHHEARKRSIIPARRRYAEFKPVLPHGCDSDFCNNTITYPNKYLRRMLKRNHQLSLFGGTMIRTTEEVDFKSRWFDENELLENMCQTSDYTSTPRAARNINNEWQFIVQIGNIKQTIEYQKCDAETKCAAANWMPENINTGCRQHHVTIKLLTLHSNGTVNLDNYHVPGGCACAYSVVKSKRNSY